MYFRNVAMLAAALAVCVSCCAKENEHGTYIALQPLGKVDDKLLRLVCRFVEIAYASPCKVMKPLDLPSSAYNDRRKQYRASELLEYLKANVPKGARRVVGITEKDIYTRQMNFIFGLADSPGKCCVGSTCRLDESFWGHRENNLLLCRRALMIVYHELGHTFGMKHCTKMQCAMCYHNSLPELDAGYVWFCEDCRRKLEKEVGSFPKDREAKLAELLLDAGLVRDAKLYRREKGERQ
jgi:archaemetzincin